MAFGSNMGHGQPHRTLLLQDHARYDGMGQISPWPQLAGYLYQAVHHCPRNSSFASLLSAQTAPLWLPSLHHILAPYSGVVPS